MLGEFINIKLNSYNIYYIYIHIYIYTVIKKHEWLIEIMNIIH